MKKILFYFENGWVFGKIHNELAKALYPDAYCDILCWSKGYTLQEMDLIKEKYDYFFSTPEGCWGLHNYYNIPLEKTVGILHQDWDVYSPLRKNIPKDFFEKMAGYAAIAPLLQNISLSHGVARIPDILRIGIFQNNYLKNCSDELKTVGSFARYCRIDQGYDVKRGPLIEEIANATNLKIIKNENINFLGVESLYKDVNLVISPSLVEGNPYPMLEAFAAGIPVLSTSTGIAPEYLKLGGGKLLPLQAKNFVCEAIKEIEKMKNDLSYYKTRCEESYNIGSMIDWKNLRQEWITFFNSLP